MTIEDNQEASYFDQIPDEILCHIMKNLDGPSLAKIRLVCWRLYNISYDTSICDEAINRTVEKKVIPQVKTLNLKLGVENLVPIFLKSLYENIPHYSIEFERGAKTARYVRRAFRAFLDLIKGMDPEASVVNLKIRAIQVKLDGERLSHFMRLLPMQLIRWTPITVVELDKCIEAVNATLEEDVVDETEVTTLRGQMVFKTSSSDKYDTIFNTASPRLLEHIGDLIPVRNYFHLAIDSSEQQSDSLNSDKLAALGKCYGKMNMEITSADSHIMIMGALVLGAYFLRESEYAIDCRVVASWFGETRYVLDQIVQLAPKYFYQKDHPLVLEFASDGFREYWNQVFSGEFT